MAITITRTTDVDDSGLGLDGTIHNNAYKVTLYDQIDAALAVIDPAWTAVTYSSGNFTCSTTAATWAVDSTDITTFAYTAPNKVMTVAIELANTDLDVATTALYVQIPGSKVPTRSMRTPMLYDDAGTGWATGFVYVPAGVGALRFYKYSGSWTTTAGDNTRISAIITFEVN